MKNFMDENFLLDTDTAVTLFREYAASAPIIDYHNHLSPREIAENRRFSNLTEIWLGGDHYKWRAMRACGVEERYITGDAPDYEKFLKWAEVLPRLAGCPLYHWTHLELQRYFGINEPLSLANAPDIWERTCELLKTPGFDVVGLLERQNVKVLCTTDDPADSLEYHRQIRDEQHLSFQVLPAFRPDRFLNVEAPGFAEAVASLAARNGAEIHNFEDLKASLAKSLDRFEELGFRVSDHGISQFVYGTGDKAEAAFAKAMTQSRVGAGAAALTAEEIADYRGALLRFLAAEYAARGVVMQLHLGPVRNQNPTLYRQIGPDAGADSIGFTTDPALLGKFSGDLEAAGTLPKMVLYNVNPVDNAMLVTMAVNFAPRVQFGAAWWFNDTRRGIEAQLHELMENGLLAESVGMLTDSRSFTSFPRHEYYRRILCRVLGRLVEEGEYPADIPALGRIVTDVCSRNAVKFFGFS